MHLTRRRRSHAVWPHSGKQRRERGSGTGGGGSSVAALVLLSRTAWAGGVAGRLPGAVAGSPTAAATVAHLGATTLGRSGVGQRPGLGLCQTTAVAYGCRHRRGQARGIGLPPIELRQSRTGRRGVNLGDPAAWHGRNRRLRRILNDRRFGDLDLNVEQEPDRLLLERFE